MAELGPASPHERVVVLDVLRGCALLGVLLGNTFHLYSGYFAGGPGRGYDPSTPDLVAAWFINLLVQSKAQTLLTFLFGFGFAAQLIRADARGEPVFGLYTRRMTAMLAFGLLHVTLLWWGDVLWTYAVAGFGLLAFHRASNRTRLIAAAVLIAVPTAIFAIPGVEEWFYALVFPADSFMRYAGELNAAIHGTDHAEVLWQQLRFIPAFIAGGFVPYQAWLVGRFLLGYVVGTLRWFDRDGADHLRQFRRVALWGAIVGGVGLVSSVFGMLQIYRAAGPPGTLRQIGLALLREMNYLGLAALYLAAVVLLFQRRTWRRLLSVIAPVGRMPLTVYLSQSLVMTFLLYGWGLGWNEVITPAGLVGLSFAVYAVQVAACTLWLRWFRYGPLEWLWRAMVYLKLPAMRA